MTYADRNQIPHGENEQDVREIKRPPNFLISVAIKLWRRNRDLLHNASTLMATTGVSAGLGFVFWAVAARLFDEKSVGFGSASISAMTLIGTIGMFGLGTILIGELPRRKDPNGLIAAALIASTVGSLVLGLIFAVIAPHLSSQLSGIGGSPGRVGLFAAGVALTALTLVVDQATIGVLRGGIQLMRNTAFAVLKLLLLPVTAFALHDALGIGIAFSWVAGMALSLLPVAIRVRPSGANLRKPDWRLLRAMGKAVLAHNWLNLALSVSSLIMPLIVTTVVSPSANAAYYVASMLAYFLYLIPTNMSTVLFAIAAADPAKIAEKLRFSLRISWIVGTIGMILLGVGSHPLLSIFGAGYARTATWPLILLVLGYIPAVPRTHYVAVCRARDRIPLAAIVQTIGAAMEIVGSIIGAKLDGLVGLSAGLLIARVIGGLLTTPTVVRASLNRDHQITATQVEEPDNRVPERSLGHKAQTYKERQEAGLAALLTIASSVTASSATIGSTSYAPHRERQEAGLSILLSIASTVSSQSYVPLTETFPLPALSMADERPTR